MQHAQPVCSASLNMGPQTLLGPLAELIEFYSPKTKVKVRKPPPPFFHIEYVFRQGSNAHNNT